MDESNVDSLYYASEKIAKAYVDFRPTFPDAVFKKIAEYCDEYRQDCENKERGLAVDVGCGPGNASIPLKKMFQQVIGVDVSVNQLKNAPKDIPGLTFRIGKGEEMDFLRANSVDLVVNGVSLQWLDHERYYAELQRVLKPGGTFAAFTHSTFFNVKTKNKKVQEYLNHTFNVDLLKLASTKIYNSMLSGYASLPEPFDGWDRRECMMLEKKYNFSQLIGFWKSIHLYDVFAKAYPNRDLEAEVLERLTKEGFFEEGKDEEATIHLSSPIFLLMAHKPTDC